MRMNSPARLAAAAVFLLISAAGCGGGDGLARQAVSGQVTLDDQPLDAAQITFTPAGEGAASTSAAAEVRAGAFSIPGPEGLIPGRYRVAISATKEAPVKASRKVETDSVTGEVIPPRTTALTETLPARYNARSELAAEVTTAGPNEFTFSLTSK